MSDLFASTKKSKAKPTKGGADIPVTTFGEGPSGADLSPSAFQALGMHERPHVTEKGSQPVPARVKHDGKGATDVVDKSGHQGPAPSKAPLGTHQSSGSPPSVPTKKGGR